jgi:transcription elongation factor Elf1
MTPAQTRQLRRCILCGSATIATRRLGGLVTAECGDCGAEFEVEFDPPDAPGLRGRIQINRLPPDRRGHA